MDEKDIKKVLDDFPSNVNVYDIVIKQSKTFVKSVVDKRLREEDAYSFDSDIEKLKGYNLLSFLYFVLEEREEAKRYNDLALQVNSRNINALACRTFYHLKRSEFYDSGQKCSKLKALKEDELEKLKAKAEVAYLFSKFGMKFYPEAEKRFEEVLKESDEIDIPKQYKCSWLFSLAQTIRRQLNMHNAPAPLEPDEINKLYQRVINLYTEITHAIDADVNRYRARAFAELGLVLYFNKNSKLHTKYNHEECMEYALKMRQDDDFVLEKCGKYFRITKNLPNAIKCFKWAIERKESSYSHHHLALCYKNCIVKEIIDTNRNSWRQDTNRNNPTSAASYRNPSSSQGNMNWGRMEEWSPVGVRGADLGRRQETPEGNRNLQGSRGCAPHDGKYNTVHEATRNRPGPMSPEEKFHSKVLKCPKKLMYFPPSKITDVLKHLDRAINLSDNTGALYDKGLIFRASKQLEPAIEHFKRVIENDSSSDIQRANSYEQAALCLLERAENDTENKDRYEFDAKAYLRKAMEIACSAIRKVPNLRRCWHSTPTLKMLLLRQARTKQNLRELANFYKLLENYTAAIGVFEQVLEMEDEDDEKQEVLEEMIKANLNMKNYDEALLTLRMIFCLPNGDDIVEKELVKEICIKGGIDAWNRCEREMARDRIKTALRYGKSDMDDCAEDEYDNGFDLFMLSSQSSEDKARQLCNNLKGFGLKITLNSDEVLGGRLMRDEIMLMIEKSRYVVVYIDTEDEETDLAYLKTYMDTIKHFKLISKGNRAARDSLLSRYPVIKFDCEMSEGNGNINVDFVQWMEEFLFKITSE